MKNILYTLFIAVFVLCSCQKQSNKNIDADIIIFTQQGCSHCEKAIDFLNNKLLVNNPAVRIAQIDVTYDQDNIKTLKYYLDKYQFRGSRVGTPVIIFNNQLVMGWSIENKVKLQRAFVSK